MTTVQILSDAADNHQATALIAAITLHRAIHAVTAEPASSGSPAELQASAARVTASLQERGIGSGERVAASIRPGPGAAAATLGVLRSGACYVPLEPDMPTQLQCFILRESRPAVLLIDRAVPRQDSAWNGLALDLDLILQGPDRPVMDLCIDADSPAFLIYALATTGEPRGVIVAHRDLTRRAHAFPGPFH